MYLGNVEKISDSMENELLEKRQGFFVRIEQKNKFCVGDWIEVMKPDGRNIPVKVLSMVTQDGREVDSAPHPGQVLWVELSQSADRYDILRVSKDVQCAHP